jgi:putative transposase
VRFEFVAKHRSAWPVTWICEVLGVSRSGFYGWLGRAPSQRVMNDRRILGEIKVSHERSGGVRRQPICDHWHLILRDTFLHMVAPVYPANCRFCTFLWIIVRDFIIAR